MAEGVDYSHARPDPQCLADNGKRFAVRYVGPNTTSGKWLREGEKDALRAAGLEIALVYQTTASFMLDGHDRGVRAANEAKAMADGLGIVGRPIYNALDVDPRALSGAQWDAVKAYLNGFASVVGRDRTGVYGGFKAIDVLCPTWAPWGWQTYAWSAGAWSGKAQLRQYLNGQQLCGGELDLCRSMQPDFGQWPLQEDWFTMATVTQLENAVRKVLNEGTGTGLANWAGTNKEILSVARQTFNRVGAVGIAVSAFDEEVVAALTAALQAAGGTVTGEVVEAAIRRVFADAAVE